MLSILRAGWRLGVLLGGAIAAVAHFAVLNLRYRGALSLMARARWLHGWCAWALPKLGIRVHLHAQSALHGLVVANHLSYLDILVFSAIAPVVFVAKREVMGWPLFGFMARAAGAIFLRRERIRELPRAIAKMEAAICAGVPVVLFPEGTTTDGASVLAFRSGLFQSAVNQAVPVTPAVIRYQAGGVIEREVCWWGEMRLLPHLCKLLSKPQVHADVTFCLTPHVWRNRKVAAIFTREQVVAMISDGCQKAPEIRSVVARSQAALEATAASLRD